MAEVVAALGVLSSVATVGDISCNAIEKCLDAIKVWKTRHKFWGDVMNRFAEYLRVCILQP
jgi:hypothetical protein